MTGTTVRPRIAFVTPRYGSGVVGGSEAVVAEAARGLAGRGWQVDVLTTCARDHETFDNELPAGVVEDRGVTVRRFRVVKGPLAPRWRDLQRRLLAGEVLGLGDELSWVSGRLQVPDLYLFLSSQTESYAAVVFSPYLFWTTLYCLPVVAPSSVLIPCLHDEPYARLRIVARTLHAAAQCWFLSQPEHRLAHGLARLPERHRVVGAAVEVPASYDAAGFRRRHGIEGPFVLFAGRREDGKGWGQLLSGFGRAVEARGVGLDLVTIGVGEASVPAALRARVRDLGYLDDSEVADAFAAASAFVQPSRNESFSRTVMEAWLAGTAVIADAGGEVVGWHIARSGGGLTYGDDEALGRLLELAASRPEEMAELGGRGRDYVLANYTWPRVLDAMEAELALLTRQ